LKISAFVVVVVVVVVLYFNSWTDDRWSMLMYEVRLGHTHRRE